MIAFVLVLLWGAAAALPERKPNAEYGSVTLYERKDFSGPWVNVVVKTPDTCYNLDCFNNKASSVSWDLPAGGNFDNHGYLTVFADMNCKRKLRSWNLRKYVYDSNLAAKAYVNENVSSILVTKTSMVPKSYVKKCSGGTRIDRGSDSSTVVYN